MMKLFKRQFLFFAFFLSLGSAVNAQTFYFKDTSTVLFNTILQSPAHWYIQVFSNVDKDTTLRWKLNRFENIPMEWVITFDDQTTFFNPLKTGDSSDFVLTSDSSGTMLIIGAITDNKPGNGVVYFDVFDPNDPDYVQTISFEFNVVDAPNSVNKVSQPMPFVRQDNYLRITDNKKAQFQIFDMLGRSVFRKEDAHEINLRQLPTNQIYLVKILIEGRSYAVKIVM